MSARECPTHRTPLYGEAPNEVWCLACVFNERDSLRQKLDDATQAIERARTYQGIEGWACPLCTYVEGKFVALCSMHRQLEDMKLQNESLREVLSKTQGSLHVISAEAKAMVKWKDDLNLNPMDRLKTIIEERLTAHKRISDALNLPPVTEKRVEEAARCRAHWVCPAIGGREYCNKPLPCKDHPEGR